MQESDDQEVVRSIGDLKRFAGHNWWSGYFSGIFTVGAVIGLLIFVGFYYNI